MSSLIDTDRLKSIDDFNQHHQKPSTYERIQVPNSGSKWKENTIMKLKSSLAAILLYPEDLKLTKLFGTSESFLFAPIGAI